MHYLSSPNVTITNSRIQAKLSELKRLRTVAKEQDNFNMEKYYETQIRVLLRLSGKTKKQMAEQILLAGDELSAVKLGKYDSDYVYNLEKAFELMQEITGIKYPEPEYVLATGLEQDARIIGYKPNSEKLVWMSPEKFLSLCSTAFYDEGSLKAITSKMLTGKPLDALFLDIDVNTRKVRSHEGCHRAKVAQNLGIKSVPVVLFAKDGYEWEDAKKLPSVDKILKQGS